MYYTTYLTGHPSGGTVATEMDGYDKMWSGGSKVVKKMNDPLLLTYPASKEGDGSSSASSSRFKNARGPGGLGYDSIAKGERRALKSNQSASVKSLR